MFSDYATADALLLHNVRHDCVNTSCGLDNDCLTSHTIHLRCVWSVLNEMHNCRRKSVTIWLGIYFGILIFRMLCWITDLRTLSCSIAKREKLYSVEGTYTIICCYKRCRIYCLNLQREVLLYKLYFKFKWVRYFFRCPQFLPTFLPKKLVSSHLHYMPLPLNYTIH